MYERPKDNQKPKYKIYFFELCSCRLFFGFSQWLKQLKKRGFSTLRATQVQKLYLCC